MEDSYRHKGLRKKLVRAIADKGIEDKAVLQAMEKIPRHWFMDNAFVEYAYQDQAFPIGSGQTISQPYTVAFQTELLGVRKRGEKVLEVGTGSGYQAAILCELKAKLFSIERHRHLYEKAKYILGEMGYRPRLFCGDGYKGLPAYAPFDRILVTCGAPEIPQDLIDQLDEGGRMVVPIGQGDVQTMTLLEKKKGGELHRSTHGIFSFVPMK